MGIHVDVGPNQRVILNGNFLPVTFRNQSKELARDIVHYVACPQDAPQPRNRRIQIMRNLVDDMIKDREQMLKDMVKALDIQDASQLKLIHNIATQMFDDQVVSWGRIVTLYSFCSYLARGCLQVNIDDCTDAIADILSDIVINRLGLWIVSNGGWKTFEQQFPVICAWIPMGVWKGLFVAAILLATIFGLYVSFTTLKPKKV